MSADERVYYFDRVISDNWISYRCDVRLAAYLREQSQESEMANSIAASATRHMQSAQRAEIERKALLKGRNK